MASGGSSVPTLYEGVELLSYEDLKRIGIKYSRAHLWRLEAAGKFPERIFTQVSNVSLGACLRSFSGWLIALQNAPAGYTGSMTEGR
jgi:hypothetical protein